MRALILICLALLAPSLVSAESSCSFCPPQYCQNVELAAQIKAAKQQAAEQRGLPKRLSVLFDQLGNCQACVEQAPDWPHLIVEYDGAAMSERAGQTIASYSSSRAWSAAGEYQARLDMQSGIVKRLHITLGAEPCSCCTATSVEEYRAWIKSSGNDALLNDPKWNDQLRTHASTTISITSPEPAQEIPADLSDIPPNLRVAEPIPGELDDFRTPPPARVAQVLCQSCQTLADRYNELGAKMNRVNDALAPLRRDLNYEQQMIDYSRSMIDSLNAVAATPEVLEQQKGHEARLQQGYANLKRLNGQIAQRNTELTQLRPEQSGVMVELRECEATQCLPTESNATKIDFPIVAVIVPPDDAPLVESQPKEIAWPDEQAPAADLPPLELYWIGRLLVDETLETSPADCPTSAGAIYLASNNGHPLEVGDIQEDGKIADVLDYTIDNNNTPAPVIKGEYNCDAQRPAKLKGTINTTVTDTVTGETTNLEVAAEGQIFKEPKSSGNPNTEFSANAKGYVPHVDWQPIATKCLPCTKLVDQYNETMSRVFSARRLVALHRMWLEQLRNSTKKDMDKEPESIVALLAAVEGLQKQLENHKAILAELEQQASYLEGVIQDCERQQCTKKEYSKISPIKLGGFKKGEYFQPDTQAILSEHGFAWNGPYVTQCPPCNAIVQQLNAVPGWLTRVHLKIAWYEYEIKDLEISSAMMDPNSSAAIQIQLDIKHWQSTILMLRKEIAGLNKLLQKLVADLALCQAKYCNNAKEEPRVGLLPGAPSEGGILIGNYTQCADQAPNAPITVGPNDEVGSSANFKEKAKNKVVGAAVGALAGLVGIGGGGGGADDGPPTYKDPIKSRAKTKVKSRKPKREIRVGAGFTDQGLLISSDIKSAPGKGTFQTVMLQNAAGWQLFPESLYLYEIWGEWKLSVSWTRDTYIDGEHVKHEEGGWTESWKELIAKGEYVNYVEVQTAPLWEQLGFNTATSGARSLGTLFPVSPEMLANGPLDLFIHITEPQADPVTTFPYHFRLSLDDKGRVVTEHVDDAIQTQPEPCKDRTVTTVTPEGAAVSIADSNDDGAGTKTKSESDTVDSGKSKDGTESNSEMSDMDVERAMKDPSTYGRRLTAEEIAKLKTKPTPNDTDGDGIQNEIDTMPDVPSDSFIAGSTIGRILDPAGQTVRVYGDNGGDDPLGGSDGVSVDVGNDKAGGNPLVEILGIELELDPGTIFDASFG